MRTFLAISAVILAVGCAKEINDNPDEILTSIEVGIDETKTVFGELDGNKRPVLWNNGDMIIINGISSRRLRLSAPSSSAVFTFSDIINTPYNILYPSTLYTGSSTVNLPKSVTSQVVPLAGQGYSVNALTSVIKLNITKGSQEATLKKIIIFSKGGVQLCGPFNIDYAAATITGTDASEDNQSIELNINDELKADATLTYYLPVPAGTYGFKVRVVDTNGYYMDKETASDKTLTKGHILDIKSFEFNPTGTIVDIVLNDAEELITFTKDFNGGRYVNGNLTVQLGTDIDFSSAESAEFAATGGIGISTNRFNGLFDGKGYAIRNLNSSVPIFAFTGSACTIKDMAVKSSCTFTATPGISDFGPIVGLHSGTIMNCTSNATINVSSDAFSAETNIGGIVGRSYEGTVSDCIVGGSILYPAGSSAQPMHFGGVVGCVDGDNNNDIEGIVRKCSFSGTLKLADETDFGGPVMKTISIRAGGIAGLVQDGAIDSCGVGVDAAIIVKGQSKTDIGGIAGKVNAPARRIKGCASLASIIYATNGDMADTTPTYIGGIVGENGDDSNIGASIEHNRNEGDIAVRLNSTTAAIGGIAGFSNGDVKNSTNYGNITRISQNAGDSSNRYIAVGGCVGIAKANGSFSHLKNTGDVTSNFPGTCTSTTVALGGVVGKVIDAASATAMDVTSCSNSGEILNSSEGSTEATMQTMLSSMCTGGIIGFLNCGITVNDCANRGEVVYDYNVLQNGRMSNTGGIVGAVRGTEAGTGTGVAGAVITYCGNYGRVQNLNFNQNYTLAGGAICGCIAGVALGTTASHVQISHCSNSNDETTTSNYVAKRGYEGGIAGWAGCCDISNCSSSKSTAAYSINIPTYNGGIAAYCESATISNCSVTSASLHASSQVACTSAGIVAATGSDTVIDGCIASNILLTYSATSANFKYGGIAGTTVAGTVIKNCFFKGKWSNDTGITTTPMTKDNITSGTSYTDGGGNTMDK